MVAIRNPFKVACEPFRSDVSVSNGNVCQTIADGAARAQEFRRRFPTSTHLVGEKFSPAATKKLASGCAGLLSPSEVDGPRDRLFELNDYRAVGELENIDTEEAAKALVEYLSCHGRPLYPSALSALMKMHVGEDLKVQGCDNVLRQKNTILSLLAMHYLKQIKCYEANKLLAAMSNPRSPYLNSACEEAWEELKRRMVKEKFWSVTLMERVVESDPNDEEKRLFLAYGAVEKACLI